MNLIQTTTQLFVGVAFAASTLLSCVTTNSGKNVVTTIADAQAAYKSTFDSLGVNLVISYKVTGRDNVTSEKTGKNWTITVHDGFATNPRINKNALNLAICHEVGHLIGPRDDNAMYADEKISDIFAVVTCKNILHMSKSSLSDGIESINNWYKSYPVAYGYPTRSERWEIMLFTLAHLK